MLFARVDAFHPDAVEDCFLLETGGQQFEEVVGGIRVGDSSIVDLFEV